MKAKIIITLFFILISSYLYQNFIINVSPSEPLGIYRIYKIRQASQIKRGDSVAVCLSSKYQALGLNRAYLLPGIRCYKTVPLIKTVIAISGDTVVLRNHKIIVNGKSYFYTTKYFDSQGRALRVFPRGVYKNTKQYWLIGANAKNSWDLRYWGGVDKNQILFRVSFLFGFP